MNTSSYGGKNNNFQTFICQGRDKDEKLYNFTRREREKLKI